MFSMNQGAKVVFIHQSAKHFIRILKTSCYTILILKGQLFRLVQLNIVSLQKRRLHLSKANKQV